MDYEIKRRTVQPPIDTVVLELSEYEFRILVNTVAVGVYVSGSNEWHLKRQLTDILKNCN